MLATARRRLERSEPHNVPGQLNVYVLDAESEVTSYGAHNRLIVSRETTGERLLTVREDVGTGPRRATEEEVRAVLNHPAHRLHTGHAEYIAASAPYECRLPHVEACIEHTFRVVAPPVPAWAIERAKEEAAAIHAALLPYAAKERRERLTRQAHGDYDD